MLSLVQFRTDSTLEPMQLTETTVAQLRKAGISIAKMASAYADALLKRKITKDSLTQSKTSFNRSESAKIEFVELTSPEQFVLQVKAFDDAMIKCEKLWVFANWPLPEWMLAKAKAIFPKSIRPDIDTAPPPGAPPVPESVQA